jgi:DNA-binding beta-propeller fold protein YncE
MLATAERASALGQLTYGGCVSVDGSGGLCAATQNQALSFATADAVSPDGKSVYEVSQAGAITVFKRAAEGQISYDGCVSNDGTGGKCTDLPGEPLNAAKGLAVSPDGRSVYTVGEGVVTVFDRGPDGQLAYAGCVSNDGSGGLCADFPGTPLSAMNAVAVSPDGTSVYVGSEIANTVVAFDRASGGQITYAGCISNDGSGGLCADAFGKPFKFIDGLDVSPDGRSVYVASFSNGTVITLDRAPGGQITYAECASADGSGGQCADVPGTVLGAPTSIVVSPDGTSVYVTGYVNDTVSVFDRVPGGKLNYAGCVSDSGSGGLCADAPGTPLDGSDGIAASADGKTLYVASPGLNGVTVLDRASGGQITYAGCVSDTGSGGLCADAPGAPLSGVTSVAASADGRSVYASAYNANTVTQLFRKAAPETTIDSGPNDGSTIADARPRFAFSSNQAGATFECSLDGVAFAPCGSPASFTPLSDGAHRFAVRAVTGGDPDPTPAARSFRVDTTGPSVAITKAPKRKIKTTKRKVNVKFAFASPEQGARFTCQLDRRPAGPCSSPIGYRIGRGKHTFTVFAIDALGNRGPTATASVEVVKQKKAKKRGKKR